MTIVVLLLVLILIAIFYQAPIAEWHRKWAAEAAEERQAELEIRRVRRGEEARELAGKKALAIHRDLIHLAMELCANEGLACDEYGRPEEYREWIGDNSPESKIKFQAAQRVAEAYKPILLQSLRGAIGEQLFAKLGAPEEYMYPRAGYAHSGVLAYCVLEFSHVNRSLVNSDQNIEVSHTATFGTFDTGYGEQYIPGDLRVTVGELQADERCSWYTPRRHQINPTAENFLRALENVR